MQKMPRTSRQSEASDPPTKISSGYGPGTLEIKQDDKFFTRIMSKETSMANSSFRVYYGDASGSVPFVWELSPGTPKHALADYTSIPPLTPPPSYQSSSKLSHSKMDHNNGAKASFLSTKIFPRLTLTTPRNKRAHRDHHVSPSSSVSSKTFSSSSSSSSSLWASSSSSSSYDISPSPSVLLFKKSKFRQKRSCSLSLSRSPLRCGYGEQEDGDKHGLGSAPASTLCFGVKAPKPDKASTSSAGSGGKKSRYCLMGRKMKDAFLSMRGAT